MQDPEIVLSILNRKAEENKDFVFSRVYRNFFNYGFYRKFNTDCSEDEIFQAIDNLKGERYIPNGGKVDEIIFLILKSLLNSIFNFKYSSDIKYFKNNYKAWESVMKIDIKGLEGNLSDLFLQTISRKINDGRFLHLVKIFDKRGAFRPGYKRMFCLNYLDELLYCTWGSSFVRIDNQVLIRGMEFECKVLPDIYDCQYSYLHPGSGRKFMFFSCYKVYLRNELISFIIDREKSTDMIRFYTKGGRPYFIGARTHGTIEEIREAYRLEMDRAKGVCEPADNGKSVFKQFMYFNKTSMIKTIGRKENISDRKVLGKFLSPGNTL